MTSSGLYASFYETDAFSGDYVELNRAFRAEPENDRDTVPGPSELLRQVSGSMSTRSVFILLSGDGQTTTIHRLMQFLPQIGRPTPHDNLFYAFVGDHSAAGITTVQVDESIFSRRNNSVRVFTSDEVNSRLANDPTIEFFGPVDATESHSAPVYCRNAVIVPPRYVPLVLSMRFTPRQLWEDVASLIIADGNALSCELFLSWCRLALTRSTQAGTSVVQLPPLVHADLSQASLREFVIAQLYRDLPTLSAVPGAPTLPTAIPQGASVIASELQAFHVYQRSRDAARDAKSAEADTLEAHFKMRFPILLRVARVQSESDLQPFWVDFIKSKKDQRRYVIQAYVRVSWDSDPLGLQAPPLVTPDLVRDLFALEFVDRLTNACAKGITPVKFAHGDAASVSKREELVRDLDMLQDGSTAVKREEVSEMRALLQAKLPTTFGEYRGVVASQVHLLQAVFGEDHPLATAVRGHLRKLLQYEQGIEEAFREWTPVRGDGPARLLFNLHTVCDLWFRNQESSDIPVPVGDLHEIIQCILSRKKGNIPDVPESWLPASNPAPISGPKGTSRSTTAAKSTPGEVSTASPVQNPRQGSAVLNTLPAVEGVMRARNFSIGKLREVRTAASVHVPQNDDGTEMCLAFHKRGLCSSNCSRAQDHRIHNAAEVAKLRTYLAAPAKAVKRSATVVTECTPTSIMSKKTKPTTVDTNSNMSVPTGSFGASSIEDDLGKSARECSLSLASSNASIREAFVRLCRTAQGQSCLKPAAECLDHPAADMINIYSHHGVPVILKTPPWSQDQVREALTRGPHQSAKEYASFVREEMSDMVKAGHWMVVPYESVADLPRLRLAPLGVVPQRDRRPRIIVDYSFYGTNDDTVDIAPDSMQFGRAFHRLLSKIASADTRRGPVFLLKIDIADAFMRVQLQPTSIPALGVVLPKYIGEPQLIAFPLVLPMGWVHSPPYYCVTSETVADLANDKIRVIPSTTALCASSGPAYVPHRLDSLANTRPARLPRLPSITTGLSDQAAVARVRTRGPLQPELGTVDVYMDDLCGGAQGSLHRRNLIRKAILDAVDQVYRPLDDSDTKVRKEPTSIKKLLKGDACWATRKIILGWIVDTVHRTIELPLHRFERLNLILSEFKRSTHTTTRHKWQQLVGELRSMLLALPGGKGLFTAAQEVLCLHYSPQPRPTDRIRLTKAAHDALDDFRWIAQTLGDRPTRWSEVIPATPVAIGSADASGAGMGGVWFRKIDVSGRPPPPLLWRYRFPSDVTRDLVTFDNPSGTLTNSDLELCAHLSHHVVLADCCDIRERTVQSFSDNSATVGWVRRASVSADSPAGYLLRLTALHQRQHRYLGRISLGTLHPASSSRLIAALRAAEDAQRRSVTDARAQSKSAQFTRWSQFRAEYGLGPWLRPHDPANIKWLQAYAALQRDGSCAARQRPIRAKSVGDVLEAIAKAHTNLGQPDPRHASPGVVDPRLADQLRAYSKIDTPPLRVKPLPLPVLLHAASLAQLDATPLAAATADLMWMAYFFLLRPSEYAADPKSSTAVPAAAGQFQLFLMDDVPLRFPDASFANASGACSFVAFEILAQKNGVKGEFLGHGPSGHPLACPVRATERRLAHLSTHGAPRDAPISLFWTGTSWAHVHPSHLTALLRRAVTACPQFGLAPGDVTARSLRSSGTMQLLNNGVDPAIIRILGRWNSDSMCRYLHLQAHDRVRCLAPLMMGSPTPPLSPPPGSTPTSPSPFPPLPRGPSSPHSRG